MKSHEEEPVSNEEVALVAYSYWQTNGCRDGHDVEDWLLAEEEVRRRGTMQAGDARAAREDDRRQKRTAA